MYIIICLSARYVHCIIMRYQICTKYVHRISMRYQICTKYVHQPYFMGFIVRKRREPQLFKCGLDR